ncbi:hexokinase I [Spathaspora passalidarum NRRL Y-27907]|uniref:Phosphotransferase n=1 Tax=Spathaspora passalidarum (strain NRRL Y-27907 / 11-Y1) TaxID=619300 RepID=G3APA5_SPAPN|nr:hexokinase I [Spathaspora passalidarum NRRL Y-27907]EGW32676.1 hexokinase I [Spathaspora passalidarum NRRL Y-27907]
MTTNTTPAAISITPSMKEVEGLGLNIGEFTLEESPSNSSVSACSEESESPLTSQAGSDSKMESLLSSIVKSFTQTLTNENLSSQSDLLHADFDSALSDNSNITMLPNYNIQPTGQEHGQFLVIDLGGSTLRIAVVNIDQPVDAEETDRSSRIQTVIEKSWIIPNDFKVIDWEFFKFIGAKIKSVLELQEVLDINSIVKTGITWSFPLETTDYNHGRIVHVSKGYTIHPDIFGKDLKVILESVLKDEYAIDIDIRIIFNDSLAVYAAGAFIDKNTKLALVLGTGLNVCCSLDSSSKVHPDKVLNGHDRILYNTELSLFGQNLVTPNFVTKYDSHIDSRFGIFNQHFQSFMTVDPNTGTIFQPHELMASGRYLPELTRLVLVDLIEAQEIFVDRSQYELTEILTNEYDGFDGELMCFINESDDFEAINKKVSERYNWKTGISQEEITILKNVTNAIIHRAAFIVAYTIVSFVKLLHEHNANEDLSEVTIGYVGSVLYYFNSYRKLVKQLINDNEDAKKLGLKVDLKLIDNSSIIGAAIGAAYYS